MKRLKLNALDLSAIETLSRQQMKNILGGDDEGYGSSNCGFQTTSGSWVEVVSTNGGPTMGTAQYLATTTDHYYEQLPNGFEIDLGTPNGHWCCDSCPW
jgi:natural product precursor